MHFSNLYTDRGRKRKEADFLLTEAFSAYLYSIGILATNNSLTDSYFSKYTQTTGKENGFLAKKLPENATNHQRFSINLWGKIINTQRFAINHRDFASFHRWIFKICSRESHNPPVVCDFPPGVCNFPLGECKKHPEVCHKRPVVLS